MFLNAPKAHVMIASTLNMQHTDVTLNQHG